MSFTKSNVETKMLYNQLANLEILQKAVKNCPVDHLKSKAFKEI